jgi:hypothetical protein
MRGGAQIKPADPYSRINTQVDSLKSVRKKRVLKICRSRPLVPTVPRGNEIKAGYFRQNTATVFFYPPQPDYARSCIQGFKVDITYRIAKSIAFHLINKSDFIISVCKNANPDRLIAFSLNNLLS